MTDNRFRSWRAAIALATALPGCADFCDVQDVQFADSLVDEQRVVAYVEDCGATVDYSSYVRVLEPGDEVEGGEVAFRSYHAYAIRLRRISKDTVMVSYIGDVWEKEENVGGITIIYRDNDQEFFDSLHQEWKYRPSTGPIDGQYQSAVSR